MGTSTISMVIFNSYVKLPEGIITFTTILTVAIKREVIYRSVVIFGAQPVPNWSPFGSCPVPRLLSWKLAAGKVSSWSDPSHLKQQMTLLLNISYSQLVTHNLPDRHPEHFRGHKTTLDGTKPLLCLTQELLHVLPFFFISRLCVAAPVSQHLWAQTSIRNQTLHTLPTFHLDPLRP